MLKNWFTLMTMDKSAAGLFPSTPAPLLVEDFDLTPEDHSGLTASVEMSRREIAGSNGIQQFVKGDFV